MHKEHELHKRRRGRNYALLAVLGGFVLLLFVVTIAKLGAHARNPTADVGSWGETLIQWMRE